MPTDRPSHPSEPATASFFTASADQPADTADTVVASRRLAAAAADELLHASAATIGRGVFGRYLAVATFVDDDPIIPQILDQARDLAADQHRPSWSLTTRQGADHVVVLAHGAAWSLVASTAGPVLVLPDWASHLLRIDQDPDWEPDLRRLVAALVTATADTPQRPD